MSTPAGVVVVGGGGHAKVVISVLRAADHSVAGVYDDDARKWGTEVLGLPVTGPIAALEGRESGHGIIAIGHNRTRQAFVRKLRLRWLCVIHPAAYVHPSVKLGPGTVVCAGAVIQPEAVIGAHAIVNTGATVDHDCQVGDYAHIAPGVHLAGGVRLEEGAFLGIGSAAIEGVRVGPWTTVGAGGVVVRDLPGHVVAIGVPARACS